MNKPRPFESCLHGLGVMSVISTVILFFPAFSDDEGTLEAMANAPKQVEAANGSPPEPGEGAKAVPVTRTVPEQGSAQLRT